MGRVEEEKKEEKEESELTKVKCLNNPQMMSELIPQAKSIIGPSSMINDWSCLLR